jgi:hypothetical protein
MKLKNDRYRKARGGYSRLLELRCSQCNSFLCEYQKDGPGILKRLYIDRIYKRGKGENRKLICGNCDKILGNWGMYEKENRPAFTLIPGSISKKIIKT